MIIEIYDQNLEKYTSNSKNTKRNLCGILNRGVNRFVARIGAWALFEIQHGAQTEDSTGDVCKSYLIV